MKVILQTQASELQAAAAQYGLLPEHFVWETFSSRYFYPDTPQEIGDVLKLRDTPYSVTFHKTSGEPWSLTLAPCDSEMFRVVRLAEWAEVMKRFETWCMEVVAERKLPDLWSGAADATRPYLSSVQLQFFARCLEALPLQRFVWNVDNGRVEIQLGQTDYFFSISSSYGLQGNYFGRFSPGENERTVTYQKSHWPDLRRLIRSWSESLQRQLQTSVVETHVTLDATSTGTIDPVQGGPDLPLLSAIRLENIRGLREFSLPLLDVKGQPRMQTVLIGSNGTCKTTLLRALALALCSESDVQALFASPLGSDWVDRNRDQGRIEADLHWQNRSEPARKIVIDRLNQRDQVSSDTGLRGQAFVYALGAGRSFESQQQQGRETYQSSLSVQGLFNYSTPMAGAELTLRRMQELLGKDYQEELRAWFALLGFREPPLLEVSNDGVMIRESSGHRYPLRAWADGYRLTLAWMLDIYSWARTVGQAHPSKMQGVMLIDEIELHLHPRLQVNLLNSLPKAFPLMQKVLTTHSPMTALGAGPGELFVLRRQDEVVRLEKGRDQYFHVEEILEDERGFSTQPYDPKTTNLVQRYQTLARQSERSPAETAELQTLYQQVEARIGEL